MSRFLVMADWDSVPHLSEEAKAEILQSIPPYQRDARTKGIPVLGSGAIFPVSESDLIVDEFPIPDHWPRCFGMDVGWRVTACMHMCLNRDTDTLYFYSEYYRGEAEPVVHAAAIKAKGAWIKGAIDPAARGRGQIDGRNLLSMYQDLGLNLVAAENAVESGIYELLTRMSTGRLKVFKSCQNWLREFRLYRRDEKGRVVKDNDHLQDSCRYGHSRLQDILSTKPQPPRVQTIYVSPGSQNTGWMS
jgi:Terminase RNaseH-like domain